MGVVTMNKVQTFNQINPVEIIKKLSEARSNCSLNIVNENVKYVIYFEGGNIVYATHNLEPFERLDLHLRRLSHSNTNITSAIRSQTRLEFEQPEKLKSEIIPQDYQAIGWLIKEKIITTEEAKILVKSLTEEVLESYLLLTNFSYQLIEESQKLVPIVILSASQLVQERINYLARWNNLAPNITSPYQRPYCHSLQLLQEALPESYQKIVKVLIGFSFRQMAVLLKQDELKLVQSLYPLIIKGAIKLKEPQSPFEQLPKFHLLELPTNTATQKQAPIVNTISDLGKIDTIKTENLREKKAKIACVDDSPTILKEINRFLEGNNLEIITINDSVKALIEIMRFKPDIILLDVGMPSVDGYQLCRLIRNSSMFKTTPIVMVTGNNSLIDRAKARVSGATDYLTKPFSQPELLKIVFRYLT